ncbi:MAG: hypothetical protein KIT36_15245 [Alphaproteobacteria bacterium]|nr:hypothetical protein [Alphaproteobacteria bacterium]
MATLPTVDPATIPESWRRAPVPLCNGPEMLVYRGVARSARGRIGRILDPGDLVGGQLSRQLDAANDAVYNQYGRDPVLTGPDPGGVVRIRIPAAVWNELVQTNSISERGNYPGFSRRLNTTEIRVNSIEAAMLINQQTMDILPPDRRYDFRSRM